jgi:hypothetical protein
MALIPKALLKVVILILQIQKDMVMRVALTADTYLNLAHQCVQNTIVVST